MKHPLLEVPGYFSPTARDVLGSGGTYEETHRTAMGGLVWFLGDNNIREVCLIKGVGLFVDEPEDLNENTLLR